MVRLRTCVFNTNIKVRFSSRKRLPSAINISIVCSRVQVEQIQLLYKEKISNVLGSVVRIRLLYADCLISDKFLFTNAIITDSRDYFKLPCERQRISFNKITRPGKLKTQ